MQSECVAVLYFIVTGSMRSQCDSILDSLRRTRAGVIADRRTAIRKDANSKFLLKRLKLMKPGSAKKSKCAWRHRFVCLAYHGQDKVPTAGGQKDELYEAGLGEKDIEFPQLDIQGNELRQILLNEFPKLEAGVGYQLCRFVPNSRSLEPLSKLAHSSLEMLKQQVGNARTYVVPLQRDLDLTPMESNFEQVRELIFFLDKCEVCFIYIL